LIHFYKRNDLRNVSFPQVSEEEEAFEDIEEVKQVE